MSAIRLSIFSALTLCACTSTPHSPAPIVDKTQANNQIVSKPVNSPLPVQKSSPEDSSATYIVKPGDGLYRIALEHGVAYKDLAAWNSITDPNSLKVGQVLRLSPTGASQTNSGVEVRPLVDVAEPSAATPVTLAKPSSGAPQKYPRAIKEGFSGQSASAIASQSEGEKVVLKQQNSASSEKNTSIKPLSSPTPTSKVESADKTSPAEVSASTVSNTSVANWGAPTAGKVTAPFTVERKGIDIAGQMGQSIVASGSGKVVYTGTGLRGYGQMIIIQHADGFLSAYAHNSKLIVKENDVVKKGEKIAEMGNTDSDQVKLHFELRKFGQPVDPSHYIKLN